MMNDRLAELEIVIRKFENRAEKLNTRIKQISFYRLSALLFGIALLLFCFFYLNTVYTTAVLFLLIVSQGILSVPHNRLINSLLRHRTYISIKQSYVDRIELNWANIPLTPQFTNQTEDPVGIDLNITGPQSLLQLVDLTTSEKGRSFLRSWLLNLKPDYYTLIERQKLIKELIPLTLFRDKLLLNARLVSKKDLNIEGLLNWLKQSSGNEKKIKNLLLIMGIWAPINIILILLGSSGIISTIWPLSLGLYSVIYMMNQRYIKSTSENAEFIKDELSKFSSLFYFLESYNYKSNNRLKELCSPFLDPDRAPSAELKGLKRMITVLSLQKNPFIWFAMIVIFPWDYFYALKLQKYKGILAEYLPGWLEIWANLEALNSLAAFAYLNPEYIFPEISDDDINEIKSEIATEIFRAEKLGHPLIPKPHKISNDFSFKKNGEIAIITGSNMSGKSTFLRTLGINLMLAYSGGPVNAICFRTHLFRVFTCIKVSDSVIDGISYFYAEVKRLKLLLDELKGKSNLPLLFLIDEIFKGTNNIERLIGSRSFIKSIAGKNGLGCVTTHDLELVKLADEINEIRNFHFREEVHTGKMHFDYVLREGPCPTTNALRIMELEGLPVEKINQENGKNVN